MGNTHVKRIALACTQNQNMQQSIELPG
uniref:Uncharacterized protein n=1 Tax=Anguilla anguilla TaxID=7936 RepID=A0A0E9VA71_ANGAN